MNKREDETRKKGKENNYKIKNKRATRKDREKQNKNRKKRMEIRVGNWQEQETIRKLSPLLPETYSSETYEAPKETNT